MGHASPSRPLFALCLLASAALGGCGRKGPLELPASAPQPLSQNTTAQADKQATVLNNDGPPGTIPPPNQVIQTTKSAADLAALPPSRAINAANPDRPRGFVLDPLL